MFLFLELMLMIKLELVKNVKILLHQLMLAQLKLDMQLLVDQIKLIIKLMDNVSHVLLIQLLVEILHQPVVYQDII